MNLWLRLLWLRFVLRRSAPADLFDDVTLPLRVWPTDLDIQGHVNNGRFLSLMDLGRLALMQRVGLFDVAQRERWMPLVRGIEIDYLKPLKLGERFTLHTRMVSWDAKWIHIEQRFLRGETLCARAHVQGLMRARNGNVSPQQLLDALGEGHRQAPEAPPAPTGAAAVTPGSEPAGPSG